MAQPAPPGAQWRVQSGILSSDGPRGTWLVSESDYADFILDFEFRLGERGRTGVGLRFPAEGDPAVSGLEVAMVDPRYYGSKYAAEPRELSGALSKTVEPTAPTYRPQAWNPCSITCRGPHITVVLNGRTVLDVDLNPSTPSPIQGKPLAERPRRGRIGFLDVSRGDGRVEIRNARLRRLD